MFPFVVQTQTDEKTNIENAITHDDARKMRPTRLKRIQRTPSGLKQVGEDASWVTTTSRHHDWNPEVDWKKYHDGFTKRSPTVQSKGQHLQSCCANDAEVQRVDQAKSEWSSQWGPGTRIVFRESKKGTHMWPNKVERATHASNEGTGFTQR